ncbi:protein AUXIN RESPONSE 4 [Impatiens glandulifera]|uniref:protein AUXIN RESPONSE 4 n=1 Tax=Impatiens glandulifera TaxID=253017 RepID=UPI001FB08B67|nr:protein AUXIN RESPONSE 4 [Impatiens glandulifera]
MAVITEESESNPMNPSTSKTPNPPSSPPKPSSSAPNPFTFWFYFTLTVSLITLLFVFLSSLSPQDPKSWFLSLPTNLRDHYSKGRSIKIQIFSNQPTIEVFSIQDGPILNSDNVLILHGLGCSSYNFRKLLKSLANKGLHTVAIDLPGSGFSDKSITLVEEIEGLRTIWDVYNDIKDKGLFWGFDQLVEQGYVNYDDPKENNRVYTRESLNAIELDSEQMGRVLGQVIDSLKLAPVDLVLHDSSLVLSANWISENPGLVRSVTLIDTSSNTESALPLWLLQVPVVREAVLGLTSVFGKVIESCCSKSVNGLDLEANRILLKGKEGRKAIVGMGKRLNCSFDLMEWSGSEGVKDLPIQVIWSSSSTDKWVQEGKRVATAFPHASILTHSGGRWPQDDNAHELAKSIYGFLSSLPKPIKESEEILVEQRVKKINDEAIDNQHHIHDDHDHGHGGFMDAYGLGHGWGS